MKKNGFTLIELMVVVLIVAILAAVAVPMMRGRIDAAKWSEGKAGAGTIVSAIRAKIAETSSSDLAPVTVDLITDLGFAAGDLNGSYFAQADYTAIDYGYIAATGVTTWTITITPGTMAGAPASPSVYVFASDGVTEPTWTATP